MRFQSQLPQRVWLLKSLKQCCTSVRSRLALLRDQQRINAAAGELLSRIPEPAFDRNVIGWSPHDGQCQAISEQASAHLLRQGCELQCSQLWARSVLLTWLRHPIQQLHLRSGVGPCALQRRKMWGM